MEPPRESSDPYVLIEGEPFHFALDGDPEDKRFAIWSRLNPTCPGCGEDLLDSLGRAPVAFNDRGEPIEVECACSARLAVVR